MAANAQIVQRTFDDDRKTTFCVYDAPTPDAVRATAAANDLPIDRITPVRVLDPTPAADQPRKIAA